MRVFEGPGNGQEVRDVTSVLRGRDPGTPIIHFCLLFLHYKMGHIYEIYGACLKLTGAFHTGNGWEWGLLG